jgi:hypothetical protein
LALLIVAIVILALTIGGCVKPDEAYKTMRGLYERNYANWSWEKRFEAALDIELSAIIAGIEFSWLDLPYEKIQVNDAAGGTSTCTDSH